MKYYLATNEVDIFHYGEMADESVFTTGQPVSFMYATKAELIAKLAEYGQEYQEPQEVGVPLPEAPPEEPSVPGLPLDEISLGEPGEI
jgi:hypothetical protein